MRRICVVVLACLVGMLSACGQKEEPAAPLPAATETAAPVPVEAPRIAKPDFGGITNVSREVEAVGSTPELAVLAALQSAVAQVNGVRVASQMQSVRASMALQANGQDAGNVRSEASVQRLLAASQGAVTGFEILSQQEIDKLDEKTIATVRASDGGFSYAASATGDVQRGASSHAFDMHYTKMRSYWKVRVRADVAQYREAQQQGGPKIVVAMPRTQAASYSVGDGRTDAIEVASAVRSRLSDILTQTKRFVVLDRELGSEMQAEIDHINSGNVRVQDTARLGQQLATDLILVPSVERFEYRRSERQLRMSDRRLVSYSGAGRVTLRLLNAATGEVVMSRSFEHQLAAADPSTMPRVINGQAMAAQMMASLSSQIGSAILTEIFPVSVVSMAGDQLVLSQGGESVKPGQRWQAVYLGDELKDPQTGRSLGRHELPIGTVRIDRVAAQTSYGTLEDPGSMAGKTFQPGTIVLRQPQDGQLLAAGKLDMPATAAKTPQAVAAKAAVTRAEPRPAKPEAAGTPTPQAKSGGADDKW